MSYEVFARKYRPRTFRELLGQDHVVQTLENAISQNRLAHAYLFVGPRGTGKTSTARILAKALNCENGPSVDFDPDEERCQEIAKGTSLDVLEIDGASNRGIDHIRDLRDTVQYAPISSRFKIYYIDEVHMLTTESFNALLKTLEEPPAHVKFIFATTEPNKILPTILSRCQRFDLRRIPTPIIADHLLHIAKEEGITLDPLAAHAVARGAEGGMRDAQSMLDQLVAFCGDAVTESDVLEVFGFTAQDAVANLCQGILDRTTPAALNAIAQQSDDGKDLARLMTDLLAWMRTLLVYTADQESALAEIPNELTDKVKSQAESAGQGAILSVIDILADTEAKMRWAPNRRLHLEIGVIKAINTLNSTSISDVLRALGGDVSALPQPAVTAPTPAPANEAAPVAQTPPPQEAPVPAQTATPEPAPASPATPTTPPPEAPAAPAEDNGVVGTEDLGALWSATLHRLETKLPVKIIWLEGSQLASIGEGRAKISLPDGADDALSEVANAETTKVVGETLSQAAGVSLRPDFAIDSSITALPEPEPEPAPTPPPAATPAPPAEEQPPEPPAATEAPSTPADAPAGEATAPPGEAETGPEGEPEKDPLIQQALEVFQAKLEK